MNFQKLLDNLLLLPEAKAIFDNYLGDEYANLMYYDKLEEVEEKYHSKFKSKNRIFKPNKQNK